MRCPDHFRRGRKLCRPVPRRCVGNRLAGLPGALCVAGPAEAIVVGKSGGAVQPVVAATTLGKGRVVAFGHEGYFWKASIETADTRRFLLNAIRWAAGG